MMSFGFFDWLDIQKKQREKQEKLRASQKAGRSKMRVNINKLKKKKGKVFRNWQRSIDREDGK